MFIDRQPRPLEFGAGFFIGLERFLEGRFAGAAGLGGSTTTAPPASMGLSLKKSLALAPPLQNPFMYDYPPRYALITSCTSPVARICP